MARVELDKNWLTARALSEARWAGPALPDPMWDDKRERGPMQPADKLSREGAPISMREWVMLSAWDAENDHAYKRIRQEHVGPYFVSTVWLGLNHGWFETRPLFFETMIFGPGPIHNWQARYSSEEEARAGHARARALAEEFALRWLLWGWLKWGEEEWEGQEW